MTDKIISVYWFAILVLVAGGIIAMVSVFYNSSYDVREIEANILINKIGNCFSNVGYLKQEVFSNGNFLITQNNFLEKCNLNFNSTEEGLQYFSQVNVFKGNDLENSFFEVAQGNKNLKADRSISKDYEKISKCVEKSFFTLDKSGNLYLIKILSVIDKSE
ncbi:MAG: hypothetical protein KJ949_01020, partial [Nanoarchaeota archaeon]|nr:hypothetical protein [Nanoarchaeota archaeon]